MKPAKYAIWVFILLLSAFMVAAIPSLNPIGPRTVAEGNTLQFTLSSTGYTGSTTYTVAVTPGYSETVQGTISGNAYSWVTDYADAGTYHFRFTVTDSTGSDYEDVVISVTNVNSAPTITSTPTTSVLVGATYTYDVNAADAQGDTITYLLTAAPSGMTIDSATGLIQWTPSTAGSNQVRVKAYDGTAYSSEQVFTLVVSNPGSSFTFDAITIGSSTAEREKTYSKSFTITNTGTDALSVFACTSNADAEYNVTFLSLPASLAAGAQATATVSAYVPEDQDGGTQKIATVTCEATGTSLVSVSKDLNLQVENTVDVTDMDISNGEDDEDIDDGDSFEVKPGDSVTFEIEVKNTGDKDFDEVTITLENEDLDIDEEDSFELQDGKKTRTTFEFEIDSDADEDDYTVDVTIEAEDEDGGIHTDKVTFVLEIKKEKHEIIIKAMDLEDLVLTCERATELTVKVENTGKNDEDDVVVEVVNTALNIHQKSSFMELDEGDDDMVSMSLEVPEDARAGSYELRINVYYDSTRKTDSDVITLNVQDCKTTPTQPPVDDDDDDDGIDVVTPPVVTPPVVTPPTQPGTQYQPVYGSETKESFMESSGYLVLLGVLTLIIVILIIVLIAKLAK